jgi:hypothetical protein
MKRAEDLRRSWEDWKLWAMLLVYVVVGFVVWFVVAFGIFELSGQDPMVGTTRGSLTTVGWMEMAWLALVPLVGTIRLWRRAQAALGAPDRLRRQMPELLRHHHEEALAAWRQRAAAHESAETRRLSRLAEHAAVRPRADAPRIEIFGGPDGWADLLTTVGTSLVASGRRLDILDLSEEDAHVQLHDVLSKASLTPELVVLPRDAAQFDIFAGCSMRAARDILVEALSGASPDDAQSDRDLDNRILASIIDVLGEPILPSRIDAALRVAMKNVRRREDVATELTAAQFDAIADAFQSEDWRREMSRRMVKIEAMTYELREFGVDRERIEGSDGAKPPSCRIISLSHHDGALSDAGTRLHNAQVSDVILQRIIRELRERPREEAAFTTLFIVGAENLQQRHMTTLSHLGRTRGVRLALLSRHVREASLEVAGSDGAVVGFMRLGPAEAKRASEFVGPNYKLIETSITETDGSSASDGSTSSTSVTHQLFPVVTETTGVTRGRATEHSIAHTRSRVYDPMIEPLDFQRVGKSKMVFLDFSRVANKEGDVYRTLVNVSPEMVSVPRTALVPFAEADRQINYGLDEVSNQR